MTQDDHEGSVNRGDIGPPPLLREDGAPRAEDRSLHAFSSGAFRVAALPEADDRPRVFPCEQCGADLVFHIGAQSLKCPFCAFVKAIETDSAAAVAEQDFAAVLARLAELRGEKRHDEQGFREVNCTSCAAVVRFAGTLASGECAYCGVPLQLNDAYDAPHRVPVDGVMAFQIEREAAHANLVKWVRSRWFAPNEFRRRGVDGRFNGVYLPFWTYDSLTMNHYRGQRGEHYWVTVGSGKNRRSVRRTRWYPASGSFQRFFDDVLIVASTGLPNKRLDALEPWPMDRCAPFNQETLAGYLARTYDVPLDEGFTAAKKRIDEAVATEVKSRIGGDEQRVDSISTRYDAVTYKHLLLPVWMMAYRFRDKAYQVLVNAATGEVQGDRPYSWVKITLASIGGIALAAAVYLIVQN